MKSDILGLNHESESVGTSKFFCMKLITYIDKEFYRGDRLFKFHYVYDFKLASQGKCRFKTHCPIYKKTIRKNNQLNLF